MDQAGQPLEHPMKTFSPVRGDRRSPDQPAASSGSRSKPTRRKLTRPMLFARKLLAPGHNRSLLDLKWVFDLTAS